MHRIAVVFCRNVKLFSRRNQPKSIEFANIWNYYTTISLRRSSQAKENSQFPMKLTVLCCVQFKCMATDTPSVEIRCILIPFWNQVLPPSSRRQATVHRTVAWNCSNLSLENENRKSRCPFGFHGPSVEIRTRGLLNPIQARYQTSPHPDILFAALLTALI